MAETRRAEEDSWSSVLWKACDRVDSRLLPEKKLGKEWRHVG
jgi:hypothetical protein